MNICCIYSQEAFATVDKPLSSPADIPFGISYIATVLKERGHNVAFMVLTPDSNIDKMIRNYINDKRPSLFCLSAVSSQFPFICSVAKVIKLIDPSIYIVLGGHHATLNPDDAIRSQYIDCVCVGEGELPIIKLASKIKNRERIREINNLWIKDNSTNEIEKNMTNAFIEDLDSLQMIDRNMWKPWIENNNRMHSILVGRGCPNRCTFCSNHILSKISTGKYVRFRSPENIILEIESIIYSNPKLNCIFLEAETLSVDLKYAYHLLSKLEDYNKGRTKKISFGANISLSRGIIGNEEYFMTLKKANFSFINIGLESGSEKVRNEILQRPKHSNEDIIKVCRSLKKWGIEVNLSVLVGIPGETLSDFEKTIQCVRKCSPTYVYLSIFYPYPGTKLYHVAKEMNLIQSSMADVRLERRKATMDLPGFSRRRIQLEYVLFYYYAFKRVWPLVSCQPCNVVNYVVCFLHNHLRRIGYEEIHRDTC